MVGVEFLWEWPRAGSRGAGEVGSWCPGPAPGPCLCPGQAPPLLCVSAPPTQEGHVTVWEVSGGLSELMTRVV